MNAIDEHKNEYKNDEIIYVCYEYIKKYIHTCGCIFREVNSDDDGFYTDMIHCEDHER